ncbi:hypothetical protein [Rhizobium sp. BK176]|uniref:hypothetical protein n=1 Tax=Rhizobium sp. BK176 TaxID=2587071 RepID=UPI0021679774|nr:hypothetical protein [Rhizobium sp. BK176]MCS4088423.1 hypothetical protein [Rhizobium sp. BK176]
MNKFHRYDFATKGYISKLKEAAEGTADVADLIPASASVQDALSEIRDLNQQDREYVEATAAYIKSLSDVVKGRSADTVDEKEAAWAVARRRVIVEAPVGGRNAYDQAA